LKFEQWQICKHLRIFRDNLDRPQSISGWTVKRIGKVTQYVMCPESYETTDTLEHCFIFLSEDSASFFADRMNAFERMKLQWIEKASL